MTNVSERISDERLAEMLAAWEQDERRARKGHGMNMQEMEIVSALRELQSLRSASTPAKAVRVKGLEWHGGKYGQIADSVFGTWWVRNPFSDGRVQLEGPFGHSMHPSTDAAVNAAEADYRQRILSALEDAPQQEDGDWLRDTAMNVMLATEVEEAIRILRAALSHPSTPATGSEHE